MKYFSYLVFLCQIAAAAECIQVDRRDVRAADFAAVLPAFRALPADLVLGYTPTPGLKRFWTVSQLNALLARHGAAVAPNVVGSAEELCVERPSRTYSSQEIEQALRAALPAEARLELVDYCRLPMPAGRLHFELKSLARPGLASAQTIMLWRGHIIYEENRSAPYWASVRVSVPHDGYYAAADLPAGHIIISADLVRETRFVSPFEPKPEGNETALLGLECRRAIRTGTPIQNHLLNRPPDVARGDVLQVRAESGSAQVTFPGRAMAPARKGETVLVQNTQTRKYVKALIEGPGQAMIQVTDPYANETPAAAGSPAGNLRRPVVARGSKVKEAGNERTGSLHPGS